jgi:arylsulfatase A-like enzyme
MMPGWTQSRYLRGSIRSVLLLLGLAHAGIAFAQAGAAAPTPSMPAADAPPVIDVASGPHTAYYFGALTRLPTGVKVTDPSTTEQPRIHYEGLPRYFRHGDTVEVTLVATGASGAASSRTIPLTLYRPNLLSINIDDLNDWVSFLDTWPGSGLTPNLERFAAHSAVFTRAYCPAPLCTPSRAAIITGRHPANTGVYFDGEWYRAGANNPAARKEEALVPYLRVKGGYTTQGAGKFAHDGNSNLQHWTEWLFGDPMTSVAPEAEDAYFRRPPEPRMPDESRLLASANQGVMLVWGVSQVAVHPAEVILAPKDAAAEACDGGGSLHGVYAVQVHNLSTAYPNRWKVCDVVSQSPLELRAIPEPCDPAANYWVDQDHGVLAPDDPLRLNDVDSTASIRVHVRRPEPFTLAVVQDMAGEDGGCACAAAAQTPPGFGPFYVQFNGLEAQWTGAPLKRGDTQRTLRITNHLATKQRVMLPEWARGGDDIFFSATQDATEWQADLEPGAHRDVLVRWAANRWIDFDAAVPTPKGGEGSTGAMDFALQVHDAQDFRRLATVQNPFKEEPVGAGQGLEISDTLITARVLEWLRGHAAARATAGAAAPKPFFVSAGIYHPHLPLFAPKEYFDQARAAGYPGYFDSANPQPDGRALPPWGKFMAMAKWFYEPLRELALVDDFAEAYKASIALADAHAGRILDAVAADPQLRDSTVIVLWSDNGFHLGEQHHLWKSTLWERAARVPLLIHIPGMTERTEIQAPVSLHDLYPTLLDLAGLPYPQFLYAQRGYDPQGATTTPDPTRAISLLPLLQDPAKPRMEYDAIPAEQLAQWFPGAQGQDTKHLGLLPASGPVPVITSFARPPMGANGPGSPVSATASPEGTTDVPIHAVRDARYRYIQYTQDASDRGNELYDMDADPWEAHNLLPGKPVPEFLRAALQFAPAPPQPPYASASTATFVSGGLGRSGLLSNPIVEESCVLAEAGETLTVQLVLDATAATASNPVNSVAGTFYFDRSQFAFVDGARPAGLDASWSVDTHALPRYPDENTPQQPDDRLQAMNFKVVTGAFVHAVTDSAPCPILQLRFKRLAPADAARDVLKVISNTRTRVTPVPANGASTAAAPLP